ncbi:hypothetical protein UlMin_036152 [Ulmus minor]
MGFSCSAPFSSHFPTTPLPIHTFNNGGTTHFHSLSSMPSFQPFRRSLLRPSANPLLNHNANPNFPKTIANRPRGSSRCLDFTVRASSTPNSPLPDPSTKQIVFSSALTIAFAIANRVLYKLALVPMKEYPFFMAQVTTFGYVVIYFSILYMRYKSGIVTDEMIAQPKLLFAAIGILEALGVAAGMASAAMLPGPAIPILSQTFLVWQLMLSVLFLGRTYSFNQIVGCILVATGVAVAITGGSNASQMLSGIAFSWPALMIASSAFQAGASIIKEFVFLNAASRLKDKSLDIFVVNSFGSGFQALFVFLFLPLLSSLKGIPFAELPSYLQSGVGCFLNIGTNTSGCDGAPWLPLLYIATNLLFNISILNLVKISSAVVSSLTVMLSVPISIYVLSIPLPYLPEATALSPFFLLGSVVLVLGLILYTLPQASKQR